MRNNDLRYLLLTYRGDVERQVVFPVLSWLWKRITAVAMAMTTAEQEFAVPIGFVSFLLNREASCIAGADLNVETSAALAA